MNHISKVFFLFLISLFIVSKTTAADYYWIGPSGGNWKEVSNWLIDNTTVPSSKPGGLDNVHFDKPGIYFVVTSENEVCNNIKIHQGSFTIKTGSSILTINGSVDLTPTSRLEGRYNFASNSNATFKSNGATFNIGTLDINKTTGSLEIVDSIKANDVVLNSGILKYNNVSALQFKTFKAIDGSITASSGKVTSEIDAKSYSDGPLSYGIAENKLNDSVFLGSLSSAKIQSLPLPSLLASTALNDDGIVIAETAGYTDLTQAKFKIGAGGHLQAIVNVTNTTNVPAVISGWIDFNKNQVFDSDELTGVTVPAGTNGGTVTLEWTGAANRIKNGVTYMRLRITTHPNAGDPVGVQANGEVEDYRLNFNLFEINKEVKIKNKPGIVANIHDTVVYKITVNNKANYAQTLTVSDTLSANLKYISSTPSGTYTSVTNLLQWLSQIIPANSSKTFEITTVVVNFPDTIGGYDANIYNIAYLFNSTDTVSSSGNCNLSEIVVNPIVANDDCAITFVNASKSVDIKSNDLPSTIIPLISSSSPGVISSINAIDSTLSYKPANNFTGLDSVSYVMRVPAGLGVPRSSDTAKMRIAVVKPLKDRFEICTQTVDTIGIESVSGVTFIWYDVNGNVINTGVNSGTNKLGFKMGTKDTTFMISAVINGCKTDSIPLRAYIMNSVKPQSVRLQYCKEPTRTLTLAKYIDTLDFKTLEWETLAGQVLTGGALGLYQTDKEVGIYKYKVTSFCGTDSAYLYTSTTDGSNVDRDRKLAVCYHTAERIQLQQILGLEASGTWTIPADVQPYVKESTGVPHAGALILNGKAAYLAGVGTGSGTSRVIELIYTSAVGSCLNGEQVKITISLHP